MNRIAWGLVVAGLFGCGPATRPPGAKPGEMLFWRITSSEVSFSQCTDEAQFRDQIQPLSFDENTYLVYRVEADGKEATVLSCDALEPATCRPSASGITFDVAGTELLFSRDNKSPIGDQGCQLLAAESWVLTDQGETLQVDISNVLSLVDAPEACDAVEAQLRRQAPNGLGLQGCVVTFKVGASLYR